MTNERMRMRVTVNKRALRMAPRPTSGQRPRGPSPTRAAASRATKRSMIEEVRLRQLPSVAILSLALVAVLEAVQAGVLLAMGQSFGVPDLIRDLILKTPWSILIC